MALTLTQDDLDAIADAVWNEILTGATHNIPTSAGRRLRQIAGSVVLDAMATGGTLNTITFDGDASAVDGAYDPTTIAIVDGTGAGQSRQILEYTGATKTAVVDRDWKVIPNATSVCVIYAHPGREHVNEGRAGGGSLSTIVLNSLASTYDDAYVGQVVFLRSGAGSDQARRVVSYVGATKTATLHRDWDVAPDNTTGYVMLPTAILELAALVDDIWANSSRTLTMTAIAINAAISGSVITIKRGDTVQVDITGLGDLSARTALYFTAKNDPAITANDDSAMLKISEAGNLLRLNGAAATTPADVTMTVVDQVTGHVRLMFYPGATKMLPIITGVPYDVQMVVGTNIYTKTESTLNVSVDVTRE